jgi:CHASE1-domain containing sensor protein
LEINLKTNENSFEDVIKKSSSRKNILFDFKKTWIAYLIFIVLVIVSFVVQSTVQNSVNQGLEAEFEKSYSSIITRLDNQYDRLFQVVNSTQGVYYQNVQVVRDIFELNGAVPVKNYSSIICMTYAPKVTQSYFPEFHYNALSEGYNNYDLHPNETRDYYYPVEHIVKYEDNLSRLAFDYASLPIMKTAIELAQSENQIVSTEFFNLRPDTLSFAIIAPIFQKGTDYSTPQARKINFKGSVVLEINSNIYFDAALKGAEDMEMTTAFPTDTQVVFSIIDKSSQGAENTVFKSSNYSIIENGNYTPTLSSAIELKIANRTLTINFATIPGFGSMQANLPIIALIVSLLLSILAFVLIIVLSYC